MPFTTTKQELMRISIVRKKLYFLKEDNPWIATDESDFADGIHDDSFAIELQLREYERIINLFVKLQETQEDILRMQQIKINCEQLITSDEGIGFTIAQVNEFLLKRGLGEDRINSGSSDEQILLAASKIQGEIEKSTLEYESIFAAFKAKIKIYDPDTNHEIELEELRLSGYNRHVIPDGRMSFISEQFEETIKKCDHLVEEVDQYKIDSYHESVALVENHIMAIENILSVNPDSEQKQELLRVKHFFEKQKESLKPRLGEYQGIARILEISSQDFASFCRTQALRWQYNNYDFEGVTESIDIKIGDFNRLCEVIENENLVKIEQGLNTISSLEKVYELLLEDTPSIHLEKHKQIMLNYRLKLVALQKGGALAIESENIDSILEDINSTSIELEALDIKDMTANNTPSIMIDPFTQYQDSMEEVTSVVKKLPLISKDTLNEACIKAVLSQSSYLMKAKNSLKKMSSHRLRTIDKVNEAVKLIRSKDIEDNEPDAIRLVALIELIRLHKESIDKHHNKVGVFTKYRKSRLSKVYDGLLKEYKQIAKENHINFRDFNGRDCLNKLMPDYQQSLQQDDQTRYNIKYNQ